MRLTKYAAGRLYTFCSKCQVKYCYYLNNKKTDILLQYTRLFTYSILKDLILSSHFPSCAAPNKASHINSAEYDGINDACPSINVCIAAVSPNNASNDSIKPTLNANEAIGNSIKYISLPSFIKCFIKGITIKAKGSRNIDNDRSDSASKKDHSFILSNQ